MPDQTKRAPKHSHASMGFIEGSNDLVAKQVRVLKLQLEAGVRGRIPIFHRIMPWLVRLAGWQLTRYQVRQSTGKAAYENLRGKPYNGEIAMIGETVWARVPGDRTMKAEAQWRKRRLAWKDRHERRALGRRRSLYAAVPSHTATAGRATV